LGKEGVSAGFGDDEGFGGSAAFESYLGGVFEFTVQKTVLDYGFGAFVPVDVAGDGFLNNLALRRRNRIFSKTAVFFLVFVLDLWHWLLYFFLA